MRFLIADFIVKNKKQCRYVLGNNPVPVSENNWGSNRKALRVGYLITFFL
jgi:hypothetical protein